MPTSENLKKLKGGLLKYLPSLLILWVSLSMLMSLPVLTHWIKESKEVYVQDLVVPLALACITGLTISAIFFRIFLKNRFAGYVGAVSTAVLLGPGYQFALKVISKFIIPTDSGKFVLMYILSVIALSLLLSFLANVFFKKWNPKTDVLAKSLMIIITVTFSIQFFSVLKVAIDTKDQSSYQPPLLPAGSAQASSDKPDIYYIVPDRYTSNEVLKEQLGYNNSDFTDFLTESGFYVKKDAYSAYPYTPYSISSTLNANYHSDLVDKFGKVGNPSGQSYHDAVHYNAVAKKLKELGYTFYEIGTQHEPTSTAPLADRFFQPSNQLTIMDHTFTTSLFSGQEIDKTVYKHLFARGIHLGNYKVLDFIGEAGASGILSNISTLKKLADSPAGGRFIFAHFLVPHHPYYFSADGSLNKDFHNDNVGKTVKQKYLGQVQFINKQLKEVISKIRRKSSNKSIIILQADEGGWPDQMNLEKFEKTNPKRKSAVSRKFLQEGDMRKWPDKDLRLKYGTLAAYHMPGVEKEDMNKYIDSVNVFRLVFNSYFSDQLPYMPTCSYAFPRGSLKVFTFTDITKRLTGKDNPNCAEDGNFNKK